MFVTFEKISVQVEKCNLLDKDGEVDCFINPSNQSLEHTSQVSKGLQEAGGQSYNMECEEVRQSMRQLRTSECLVARTGDRLRTKHVIHAICPIRNSLEAVNEMKKNEVYETIFNCLQTAAENKFKSLGLTFLSTGMGNLPIEICGLQYALAVTEFSRVRRNTFVVSNICFVDRDEEKVQAVTKVFENILPSNVMQLLEVPIECYDDYPEVENNAQRAGQGNQNIVNHNRSEETIYDGMRNVQDSVDGATMRRQPDQEAERNFGEYGQVMGRGNTDVSTSDYVENDGYEVPVRRTESMHGVRTIEPTYLNRHVRMDSDRFSFGLGKYTVLIKKKDIRVSKSIAVVCPENCDVPFGGFLAVAIKCRYERNNIRPVLDKKVAVKKNIATSEIMTSDGDKKYILHVPVTVWRAGNDEETIKNGIETSVRMIFDKLAKPVHAKRNITSVAIPLLGIDEVESPQIVSLCCEVQARTVCEVLSERDIPNLQTVYLLNRCGKITSTLIAWANIWRASNS